MSNDHLTPLQVAEALIGPPTAVSRAAGLTHKAAYNWRFGSAVREAGDIPTVMHMRSILAYAAAHAIPLKPEHLIWGAPAAEVEALLGQMQHKAAAGTAAE